MAKILDSGERIHFDSGAVRDVSDGKGRCDLLPLDTVNQIILKESPVLSFIEMFKNEKQAEYLYSAIKQFALDEKTDLPTLFLELSKHFEEGATKYGENNWKKGIPLHCYLDSAVRHYLKHYRGDTDEPHDRAFVWNLLCCLWTFDHKKELDDIEVDLHTD